MRILSKLTFRGLVAEDKDWLVETANDPDVAKYAITVYPITEHEVEEYVKKDLEEGKGKYIVAELNGKPAGSVFVGFRDEGGRDRHIAWLGIQVRREFWGKGVGKGLMAEAIRVAKESGCRRLMLGTIEGNERAIGLYGKFGFKTEAFENKGVYVDGSWRNSPIMGLDLAPCEPRSAAAVNIRNTKPAEKPSNESSEGVEVRQLIDRDVDGLNRLQNCQESTKSSYRIPPITKEETKRWYQKLSTEKGMHCFACIKNDRLLGYAQFKACRLPFPCLKFEEFVVDVTQQPRAAANALVSAVKGFIERYWYHRIFAYVPATSVAITGALEENGFSKAGALKGYYYIDGYYVDSAVYEYQP